MIDRRALLSAGVAMSALTVFGQSSEAGTTKMTTADATVDFKTLSEAEWKKRLTPEQFYVLRKHGTERAGTSPLDKEHRGGTFHCAGCDLPLFASNTKFDSGTGWPSFWQPLDGAVGTSTDHHLIYPRTEVHCRRCGGHLGHVFDDGPPPTGQRYCMNGVSLRFVAADAAES
jgi:peptide-methionine (R)-S-oxide reductase